MELYSSNPDNSDQMLERIRRGNQTRFGHDDSDVKTPHFWVECKHHKRVDIKKAMRQAVDDMNRKGLDIIPIAVTRDNGKPIYVTMELSHFKDLVISGVDLKIPENYR